MDVAEELGMWWRDLQAKIGTHWDLLLYIAHRQLRHPPAGVPAPTEEVDDSIQLQKAEAMSLLRS